MSDQQHVYAPLWGHIEDLRRTLLRVLGILVCGVCLCFVFYVDILTLLTSPFHQIASPKHAAIYEEKLEARRLVNSTQEPQNMVLPEGTLPPFGFSEGTTQSDPKTFLVPPGGHISYNKPVPAGGSLVILGPLEGILIALKTSVWVGGVLTSPLWLWVILQFVVPALHAHERRLILPFFATSLLFITGGCLFAFTFTIPIANQYLTSFNTMIGTNLWSLTHYLDYTLFLLLANGLAFEMAALGIFAVHLGLLSTKNLTDKRRIAYVMAFVIGALLTPPDIFTQVMMAIPLICLYEVLIAYSRLKRWTKKTSRT